MPATLAKSVLADVVNPMVMSQRRIHEDALLGMIENGLRLATRRKSAIAAWKSLLKTDDVIGLKFDEVGSEALGTTDAMAGQLLRSLERAGFSRKQVVLIDVPTALARDLGTISRRFGWSTEEVSLGGGKERLAAVLEQVSAIINVPFLKTDQLSGIWGCLRNVSIPFVRRQTPYFVNGCVPAIADIVSLSPIRSKLKIHIMNAIRVVFDKGPEVYAECVWPRNALLVSADPVAVDQVGTDILNDHRLDAGLPILGDQQGRIAHVYDAARRGLGTVDQDYIQIVHPE